MDVECSDYGEVEGCILEHINSYGSSLEQLGAAEMLVDLLVEVQYGIKEAIKGGA